jgi:hypothetical protein
MNIPTAEEFAKTYHPMKTYPVDHQMMIEFAKLHVEAAKEEISKKARTKSDWSGNTGSEYCDTIVDKDSILNSYPLTNIK